MAHQVNKCTCGRTIHWPRTARVGDTWKCQGCGTIWNLVPAGTPGADASGRMIPSWGHSSKRGRGRVAPPARRRSARPPRSNPTHAPATPSGGLAAGLLLGLAALAGLARR